MPLGLKHSCNQAWRESLHPPIPPYEARKNIPPSLHPKGISDFSTKGIFDYSRRGISDYSTKIISDYYTHGILEYCTKGISDYYTNEMSRSRSRRKVNELAPEP